MTDTDAVGGRHRRRAIWVVVLALIPVAVTATLVSATDLHPVNESMHTVPAIHDPEAPADGSEPQTSESAGPDVVGTPSADTRIVEQTVEQPIGQVSAPEATASPDPASFVPEIKVILPPPPPPATSGGRRGGGHSSGGSGSSGDYISWCNAGGGASFSASTLSGLISAANSERSLWGFGPLSSDSSLANPAQAWSESMASNYDPAHPGNALAHGMLQGGGQNVAASWTDGGGLSQGTAMAHAHTGWMKSPGHCKNLLNPKWTRIGVGTAQSSDGKAWYTTANYK